MAEHRNPHNDFLFTWKPDKWPYEKLKNLIDGFEAGQVVEQNWRCRAIRMIHPGSKAYLLKQGHPRGIFGIATIIGRPQRRVDVKAGESPYEAPLRFELLVDPTARFLLTEEELAKLPAPSVRWNTVASGMPLEAGAARLIDDVASRKTSGTRPNAPSSAPSTKERLSEVYERDQSITSDLKKLYQGKCQICGSQPFDGAFGCIAEGHHITWLSRGGLDNLENMLLLCPNHHAAVHSFDPAFDWDNLKFKFGVKEIPIRLNSHLKQKK